METAGSNSDSYHTVKFNITLFSRFANPIKEPPWEPVTGSEGNNCWITVLINYHWIGKSAHSKGIIKDSVQTVDYK